MHGQKSRGITYPYHAIHKRTSASDRKSARSFPISLGGERLERASQVEGDSSTPLLPLHHLGSR
jgi:hypothetical protein